MANDLPYLIVIGGPTASGKTALSIHLAEALQTEILNADSRQFYREMKIGTARPSPDELKRVPHHFVGDRSVTEPLSAGAFARLALKKIADLFQHHKYVILSGGSGLFIRAITKGLDTFPEIPPAVRSEIDELFKAGGLAALQALLAEKDPDYYAIVDQQNPARLRRALEVIQVSGKPFSSFHDQQQEKRPFQCIYLSAYRARTALYQRIDQRVDEMMHAGLLEEVKSLNLYQNLPTLRTLGYQELFAHLNGDYDLATAVDLIKQGSRRYAKRQITWLRRDGFWKNIDPEQPEEALQYLTFLQEYHLSLHSGKEGDKNCLEFYQADRVVASQVYRTGKKGSLGANSQISEAPKEATFWLQQEAERRLTQ